MTSCYVNGRWKLYGDSLVHIEDRGFQFGDGVYEALAVQQGTIIDLDAHLQRLKNSLDAIKLAPPIALSVLPFLMREAITRNHLRDGLIYLQITRGQAKREHIFPHDASGSLIIIARALSAAAIRKRRKGVHVITLPDQRWKRCDIKSINLLANVLARQEAHEQMAQEAWLYDEQGLITEGTASNAWIIKDGVLFTRKASPHILSGITRQAVLDLARGFQMEINQQGFTRDDAFAADAAFITSSIGGLIPVLSLDGVPIKQGENLKKLQAALEQSLARANIKK